MTPISRKNITKISKYGMKLVFELSPAADWGDNPGWMLPSLLRDSVMSSGGTKQPVTPTIWDVLMMISTAALIVGIIFLVLELGEYGFNLGM
jgi:hypothetical protein